MHEALSVMDVMFARGPEAQLLICCARTHTSPEWVERIKALLRQEIDWAYLYRLAEIYGMMPLLYWHLDAASSEVVPKAGMDYLRDYFHANIGHNLYLTGELCSLLQLLDTNGVPAIPFRGPALAESVYGNPALRQFSNLDILVREQDVAKVRGLLVSQGYRPRFTGIRAKEAGFLQCHSEFFFLHNKDRTVVDVQLRILAIRRVAERLWKRLEPLSLGDHEVLTLSPEDLLLSLCVHGIALLWEEAPWICDVSMLVGTPQGMDWEGLFEHAGRLGSTRMLSLGLYLARDLLGAALPVEVLQRVRRDSMVAALAAQVRDQRFLETADPPAIGESFLFQLKARDRLWDRIRYGYNRLRPLCFMFRRYGWNLFHGPGLDLGAFVETPREVVVGMLALAEVGPTDVVYDLGCGDGRIVITAAKRFGARGVGVDIDSRRIAEARANARREGVEHLVTFIQQDAKAVEMSDATVVTLFLSGSGNLKLRKKLQTQLRTGARIVSRSSGMAEWSPEATHTLTDASGAINDLYLWRIVRPVNRANSLDDAAITSCSHGPLSPHRGGSTSEANRQ